jgi:hypothetical protein
LARAQLRNACMLLSSSVDRGAVESQVRTRRMTKGCIAGAAGIITKPFDPMTLAATAKGFMKKP